VTYSLKISENCKPKFLIAVCQNLHRKANKKRTEDSEIPSRNLQILYYQNKILDLDKT